MYIPNKSIVKDPSLIQQYISENPFGTLINHNGEKSIATHTIFRLIDNKLYSHISIANEQKEGLVNQELIAVFMQKNA